MVKGDGSNTRERPTNMRPAIWPFFRSEPAPHEHEMFRHVPVQIGHQDEPYQEEEFTLTIAAHQRPTLKENSSAEHVCHDSQYPLIRIAIRPSLLELFDTFMVACDRNTYPSTLKHLQPVKIFTL